MNLPRPNSERSPMREMAKGRIARSPWLLAVAFALAPSAARCQTVEGQNVKMALYYEAPNNLVKRMLLQGAKAQPLEKGRTLISGSPGSPVSVQTFSRTGELEMVLETPECLYDESKRSVSSPGPLSMRTADGKFSIEGEGYLWQQTNSSPKIGPQIPRTEFGNDSILFISNRVHTVTRPSPASRTNAPPEAAAQPGRIDIFSDRFEFSQSSGLAAYRENVRFAGTNLAGNCGVLTALLQKDHRLQSMTMDHDVVLDYTNMSPIHATAQQAVYQADSGLIQLKGNPAWLSEGRQGGGDDLLIDPTNRILHATGNAWLKMPDQGIGAAGFLPKSTPSGAGPGRTTNGVIEIQSESYELRTNSAVFNGQVRMREVAGEQLRGTMDCDRVALEFSKESQLQNMVAVGKVRISQMAPEGTRVLKGERVVYTGTNGLMVLTDHPSWQAGPREGKGERILIDTLQNLMAVQGNASMRLPATELARASSSSGSLKLPRIGTATNEFTDIFSEDYVLQETNALFTGGVYISHTNMNWVCETMTVNLPQEGGRIDSISAEQGVVFDLLTETGQKVHGTGDRALYSFTIDGGVTNNVVRLIGNPAKLATTNGLIVNRVLILDLGHDKLLAQGSDWGIRGTVPGIDTNQFRIPGIRGSK
jgi:lipopolysaccharide export system protein LptA